MGQLAVEINQVAVERNGRNVLIIEHFTLKRGELAAVVGANGAGKSTFLQTIDLLCSFKGEIFLFGQRTSESSKTELRRRLSLVFQEALFLHDTVLANVIWGLRIRGMAERDCRQKALEALSTFRCEHLADRMADALSGGEAQRVSIARALALEPELLLLDEPFSAQDVTVRSEMLGKIRQIAREKGMTVLLVSHNFSDVLHFADRVMVMLAGQIAQDAAPESVMRHPVNVETAKLVGMDNIIPCSVIADGQEQWVKLINGITFSCPLAVHKTATVCCLTGDALYIWNGPSLEQRGYLVIFDGIIERLLPGIGAYVVIVTANNLTFTVRLSRDFAMQHCEGTKVKLAFDANEAHFI